MIKVAVVGAAGRMGRKFVTKIMNDPALELSGALEYENCPLVGQDAGVVAANGEAGVKIVSDVDAALSGADCLIDFTLPDVTRKIAPVAAAKGISMVIGSTGLTDDDKVMLSQLAANGARIVQSPNMSVGVNLLFALCDKVARILNDSYDIEVVEMHHNQKKDAPSGTAVRLGEILAEARGLDYKTAVRHGREGLVGSRTKSEIGIHALRGGDVVGDHTVIFATGGERIELTHKASSRDTFALGAMRAVKFLATVAPGVYDMQDVLGLK